MSVSSLQSNPSLPSVAPRSPQDPRPASITDAPELTNMDCYKPGNHWVDATPEVVVFDLPSSSAHTANIHTFSLPTQKAPELQRPVLLIHGYNSVASDWVNMHTWLTGSNAEGGVVGPGTGAVNGKGKVFEAEFSRPFNGIKMNATELKDTIDRITAATGSKQIDVIGHSMGGLDARYYIEEGGDKIKNMVMIATPNHGSALADIELSLRDIGIPIKPSQDDPEIRQCFRDLCEDRKDGNKQNNPVVHDLNSNWDRQRNKTNTMVIAGCGTPTLLSKTILTVRGDGVVPRSSAFEDKIPVKNVWWTTHNSVKEHPDTLMATGNFLTGKSVDMRDEDPPNIPPDKAITPLDISADSSQVHYLIQEKQS